MWCTRSVNTNCEQISVWERRCKYVCWNIVCFNLNQADWANASFFLMISWNEMSFKACRHQTTPASAEKPIWDNSWQQPMTSLYGEKEVNVYRQLFGYTKLSRFRTAWGGVNDNRIFHFWVNCPFTQFFNQVITKLNTFPQSILHSTDESVLEQHGGINNHNIVIFGWTIPLIMCLPICIY